MTIMVASSRFSLVAGIGKKVCILASLALLITHPAINNQRVLSFGDSQEQESHWTMDGEDVERELLRLWAYGGLVNTSADPWFGIDADLDYLFAYESIAGPSPDLYIEDTRDLVKTTAGEGADAVPGDHPGIARFLLGSDIKNVTIEEGSLSELYISMQVTDFFAPAAETMHQSGFRKGDVREYRVSYSVGKQNGSAPVTYFVAARQMLQRSDLAGWFLTEPQFVLGVVGRDGVSRTLADVDGFVDGFGTITWIVPRAELNVTKAPASFTAAVERGSMVCDGDVIRDVQGRVTARFVTSVLQNVSPAIATLNEVEIGGAHMIGGKMASSTRGKSLENIFNPGM